MESSDRSGDVEPAPGSNAASDGRASVAILILTAALIIFLITRVV